MEVCYKEFLQRDYITLYKGKVLESTLCIMFLVSCLYFFYTAMLKCFIPICYLQCFVAPYSGRIFQYTIQLFVYYGCSWAISDKSVSPNYTKNGCPGNPGHPLGMPNKVRELQLSNTLQPQTAAQIANEPQKLEYLRGPRIYKALTTLIEFYLEVSTHINRSIARVGICFSENPPFSQE